MDSLTQAIEDTIKQADKILVVTHVGPDGDAIGSLTAVGQVLQQMGKPATLMCDDNVPERFRYLPLADQVQRPLDEKHQYDLLIAVDCGDEQRMGQSFAKFAGPSPATINIDHHITNTKFGDINVIDTTAVSTTEILYDLFATLGVTLNRGLAMSLLTGLVTDTLGFRTSSTSAKTLKIASTLVDTGADLPMITQQGLALKKRSTILLWRYGLEHMRLEDGLAWTVITAVEREAAGFNGASSNGLSNLLSDIEDVAIGAVLMEMGDGRIRVGFRSRPPYDVARIAMNLGGGGHANAAGCMLEDIPLDKVEAMVVSMCKEAIRQQDNT